MVLIITGRDWIGVNVAPSYISSALHQSRIPRGTFLVAGRRFRRRLSPFARKLGRNSKNASMERFLLRQFITALTLETQILYQYRDRRRGPPDTIGGGTWCSFARRASKLCGRHHRRVNCLVSSPVARRYCGTWLHESSDLADKYYPECQPRSVITCRVVARSSTMFHRWLIALSHLLARFLYMGDS